MPVATAEKNGLMSNFVSGSFVSLSNEGNSTNQLFHIEIEGSANLLIAVARDNSNALSYIIIAFNNIGYKVITKGGSSFKFYCKVDGGNKLYYIQPISTYGIINIFVIKGREQKISFVNVTNSVSTSELETIL